MPMCNRKKLIMFSVNPDYIKAEGDDITLYVDLNWDNVTQIVYIYIYYVQYYTKKGFFLL